MKLAISNSQMETLKLLRRSGEATEYVTLTRIWGYKPFERNLIWYSEGEIFNVTIGRAACEACSATWNLGTNPGFALVPRKTAENLHRVSRWHDLKDANWLIVEVEVEVKLRLTVSRPVCHGILCIFVCIFVHICVYSFHTVWCLSKSNAHTNNCKKQLVGKKETKEKEKSEKNNKTAQIKD
jgi:hypothetical protein